MSDVVSSEEIRDNLSQIKDRCNLALEGAEADRIAAILRDAIIRHGGNPADRSVLFGALVASWCGLKCAMQTPTFPLVSNLWYQAEVLRRMVDGEVPVLTVDEILGLERIISEAMLGGTDTTEEGGTEAPGDL